MTKSDNSNFRTVRGYQIAKQEEGYLTSALEDYLEMIYRLCVQNESVRVGKLSELLNVRPSSVSKMIFKLVELKFVKYNRYDIIQLTDSGRKTGEYLLKRHDTVEKFLTLIGSTTPLEETELIEHALSLSTVSNLTVLLEFFQSDTVANDSYENYKKNKMTTQ
ncbi:MAG TPA: DtxR family transcriptional regulator [Clostridiales bacterium]|nr:DtxR family transcriptional regulator [Clostridiales bacterium]